MDPSSVLQLFAVAKSKEYMRKNSMIVNNFQEGTNLPKLKLLIHLLQYVT